MDRESLRNFFLPLAGTVTFREKIVAGFAAFSGIICVAYISQLTTGADGLMYMAASMGSAAVLLFAAPHAPMAQPWPLIGGHLVSAFIGVLCYKLVPLPLLSAAAAVGLAIFAMFMLRCMNPPGGAAALGAVMGGDQIHALGFEYVFMPVALNVLVIFIVALLVNNAIPGRRYPLMRIADDHDQRDSMDWFFGRKFLNDDDLEQAMTNLNTYVDADREDLKRIYQQANLNAYKRRLGTVFSRDIMKPSPILHTGDSLARARQLFDQHAQSILPVVDEHNRLQGLVSRRTLAELSSTETEPSLTEPVDELMLSMDERLYDDQHIVDAIPVFSDSAMVELPVVMREGEFMGMLSRADILSALLAFK